LLNAPVPVKAWRLRTPPLVIERELRASGSYPAKLLLMPSMESALERESLSL
jgi:hypothetical protein